MSSSEIVIFVHLCTSDIHKSIVSELALYADGICIYDQTKKTKDAYLSVQHHLDDIRTVASPSRINISGDKSFAITFSRKNKISVPKLTLDNVQIDYFQEYRYLWVHPAS